MCCSVLQCVAVCCSVLQCGAVYTHDVKCLLQCVAVRCSVLQCVTACCSVLQCRRSVRSRGEHVLLGRITSFRLEFRSPCSSLLLPNKPFLQTLSRMAHTMHAVCCSVLQRVAACCSVLQCVVVCCSVLQCVAMCCSVLQCVAVCCSVLQCVAVCCIHVMTT